MDEALRIRVEALEAVVIDPLCMLEARDHDELHARQDEPGVRPAVFEKLASLDDEAEQQRENLYGARFISHPGRRAA